LAAQPAVFKEHQQAGVNNILDLVEADISAHISRGRPELLEFLRITELPL
jgi:hypothetical protein